MRLGETAGAPRVSDMGAVMASTAGKIELESVGEEAPEERIVERLITKSLYATFNRRLGLDELEEVVDAFDGGFVLETGDRVPSREYVRWMREVPGMASGAPLGASTSEGAEAPAVVASAVEFVLRGSTSPAGSTRNASPGAVYHR